MTGSTGVITNTDVARCPDRSLLPSHYRAGGDCKHVLPAWIYDARVWPRRESLPYLAPGLRGIEGEFEGIRYVPVVWADIPGTGATGTYIEALPYDKPVVFPTVISEALVRVLERNGFVHTGKVCWAPDARQWVDGHRREGTKVVGEL